MNKKIEINSKNILNFFTLLILILVPLFKMFSMYLEHYGILSVYDSINPSFILYLSIPFLIFTYIYDLIKNKKKIDIYDKLFYILILVGVIVCFFSINKSYSFLGKSYRHEGYLSLLSYYLIFINWKNYGNDIDVKRYKKILYVIALINSLYALLQIYTNFSFIIRYELDIDMASGLCGNPNFFGTLIVTTLSIITCEFLFKKKYNFKDIGLIILLFISLINCQSTGPFLAYILTFIFMSIYLSKKGELIKKNLKILCILLPLMFISINTFNYLIESYKISVNSSKRISELSIKGIKQTIVSGGNGRLQIWKNSIDIVEKYWLTGVGYDNFILVYPNPKIDTSYTMTLTTNNELKAEKPKSILVYDNAHNIYLHTLVSSGIIGLIPYLLLCLLTFIKGLKSNNKNMFILLVGFIAYSIQGFANISVINVAPIYFLIIGLMLSIKE